MSTPSARNLRSRRPCILKHDPRNVGDSAIWLGATTHFREHRGAEPGYVASIAAFSEAALRASVPEGPIFIHSWRRELR